LGLVVLCPLPFGAVQPGAVLALELCAAVAGAAALVILSRDPQSLPPRARRLLLAGGSILAIALLQLVPLPAAFVRRLGAPTASLREALGDVVPQAAAGWAPLSLSPPDTADAALRFLAYVLVGLAVAVSLREAGELRRLAVAVAASGAFQALYGSAECLSGHQHIFRYAKRHFLEAATGTFINRNHFAGYLAMALPFALVLCWRAPSTAAGLSLGWRHRLLRALEPRNRLLAFGMFCGVTMWAGVLLSMSRSGLVCASLATLLAAADWTRRRRLWIAVLAFGIPVSALLFAEVHTSSVERLAWAARDLESPGDRLTTWRATVAIAAHYPILGSGLGTFASAFPLFHHIANDLTYTHAHNDWLQGLAEGGVGVPAVLVAVLLAGVRHAARLGVFGSSRMVWPRSLLASVAGVAGFSALDFCLRIPANAVLLSVVLGAFGSRAVVAVEAEASRPASWRRPRPGT
jgi:hypothetical protein